MRTKILLLFLFFSQFCLANEAENNCLDQLYGFSADLPVAMKNAEEQAAIKASLAAVFSGNEADSLLITGILNQSWVDSSYQKGIERMTEKTLISLQGKLNLFERLDLKQQFTVVSANLGKNNAAVFETKKVHIAGLTAEKLLFAQCQKLGQVKIPFQMPEKISSLMLAFSSLMAIIGLLTGLYAFYRNWRSKKTV